MNTSFHHGSAKIYQFPVRGRASIGSRQEETKTIEINAPRVSEAACGSGWYHEAAIEEDSKRPGGH
jgi:Protein of unknown function (DUF2735)